MPLNDGRWTGGERGNAQPAQAEAEGNAKANTRCGGKTRMHDTEYQKPDNAASGNVIRLEPARHTPPKQRLLDALKSVYAAMTDEDQEEAADMYLAMVHEGVKVGRE